VAQAGRYQTVVVDTAPTGHTLRLLSVPDTLRRIAGVLGEMLAKHHFLLTRLSGRDARDPADGLVAEIDGHAHRLAELLRDPRHCRFRWVVLPELLAVEEARDAVGALEARGITVGEILVNRVTPAGRAHHGLAHRRRAAEREAIAAVHQAFPGRVVRLIPELAREPRGSIALRPLVRGLTGRPARQDAVGRPGPAVRARPARGPRGPASDWASRLAPPGVRLLLVVGKGGVGKTTWAAAAALALGDAAAGRRILLLSTDPAHSLGDVFTVPLDDAERRVPGGPAGLRVRELDADRAFAARRERYRGAVDALFDSIRGDSRFDVAFDRAVARDLLDLAPGGVDELCALLAVTETLFPPGAASSRHDLVVVDAAPTGHTLRLLGLPGLALEWVRALLATLLKYRQVLGLGTLAADLVELSRGFRQLQAVLGDARRTRVVVVARPAALPRLETGRLLVRLDALGLATSAMVVNAVTPSAVTGEPEVTPNEAAEIRLLRAVARPRPEGPVLLLAPAVAPPPRGVDALRAWARTWTRDAP
jgi:arsenite-transporting ATPase